MYQKKSPKKTRQRRKRKEKTLRTFELKINELRKESKNQQLRIKCYSK